MIEKILERLEEEETKWKDIYELDRDRDFRNHYAMGRKRAFTDAISVVQEVAKDGGWIPVTYHVATDEEREELCLSHDIAYILDCPMPDDEQEIIVCNERYVWVDTCMIDEGYSLDSGNDWCGDVIAWMPMPKKYEPKKQKGE